MHHQTLRIIVLLFISLLVLQSLLGGAVFATTVGWTPQIINDYYIHKTLHGLLETLVPHALLISVALMGTLHFLGFINTPHETKKGPFIHLLFALFAIDQTSPLLISLGMELFVYVKIAAFLGFQIAVIGLWGFIFQDIVLKTELTPDS